MSRRETAISTAGKRLRDSLLQTIYGSRSEQPMLDALDYNLLFRWLMKLSPDDPIIHHNTLS